MCAGWENWVQDAKMSCVNLGIQVASVERLKRHVRKCLIILQKEYFNSRRWKGAFNSSFLLHYLLSGIEEIVSD